MRIDPFLFDADMSKRREQLRLLRDRGVTEVHGVLSPDDDPLLKEHAERIQRQARRFGIKYEVAAPAMAP